MIGELNNAYRDTRANFAYGKRADSTITVAFNPAGAGLEPSGTVSVTSALDNQEEVNGRTGSYARQIASDFLMVR